MAGIVPQRLLTERIWVKRYTGTDADGYAQGEHDASGTAYPAKVKKRRRWRRDAEGMQTEIVTHVSVNIDVDPRDLVSESETGTYVEPKNLLRSQNPGGLTRSTFEL